MNEEKQNSLGLLHQLRYYSLRPVFGTKVYRWTFWAPSALQEPTLVPPQLWVGNVQRGEQFLDRQFKAGFETIEGKGNPWNMAASDLWLAQMHSFSWLKDLQNTGIEAAIKLAQGLTIEWLDWADKNSMGSKHPAWRADIIGQRITHWITFYKMVYQQLSPEIQVRILRSIDTQAKHLYRILGQGSQGLGQILAVQGLIVRGLFLTVLGGTLETAIDFLELEIEKQILPDGGHISRNPQKHFKVLKHLVEIRASFHYGEKQPPTFLFHAIDQMAPMLRFFLHGDDDLALFNGACEVSPDKIEMLLAQADNRTPAPQTAKYSGFERIVAGKTHMIVDAQGVAPKGYDGGSGAGLGAFELSYGLQRIIVNCGGGMQYDPSWRQALSTTAAYSTLTVHEQNALMLDKQGHIIGRRPLRKSERHNRDGATWLTVTHDGYWADFEQVIIRKLYLSADGIDLRGEDCLEGPAGVPFAIRFHLHPSISVGVLPKKTVAILKLPNGDGWRMRVFGGAISLEPSIYCGQEGQHRKCQQIILTGTTQEKETSVKWVLQKESKAS